MSRELDVAVEAARRIWRRRGMAAMCLAVCVGSLRAEGISTPTVMGSTGVVTQVDAQARTRVARALHSFGVEQFVGPIVVLVAPFVFRDTGGGPASTKQFRTVLAGTWSAHFVLDTALGIEAGMALSRISGRAGRRFLTYEFLKTGGTAVMGLGVAAESPTIFVLGLASSFLSPLALGASGRALEAVEPEAGVNMRKSAKWQLGISGTGLSIAGMGLAIGGTDGAGDFGLSPLLLPGGLAVLSFVVRDVIGGGYAIGAANALSVRSHSAVIPGPQLTARW